MTHISRVHAVKAVLIRLAIAAVLCAAPLFAQEDTRPQVAPAQPDISALMQKIRDLEDRIIAIEGEMRQVKDQQAATQSIPPAEIASPASVAALAPAVASTTTYAGGESAGTSAQEPTALGGAGTSAAKALNPDISVIGDFIGVAGHNDVQPSPSLEMHESEVGLQAILDPYARGDFFLSFGEEGVELEEGYITFTALPAGFVAKSGQNAVGIWEGEHAAYPCIVLG